MKILNFGSCNIDTVYCVQNIVMPGETIAAKSVDRYPGGKGLNQSVAISRAGSFVYHAGCIGGDGDFLYSFISGVGVDTSYVKRVQDSTGQAFIQVSGSGENSIVIYRGANYSVTREYVDYVLQDFYEGDILLLQNEISEVGYIIDTAFSRGMKIFLNPSPLDEAILGVDLNKIHCLIVNSIEARGYVGASETGEGVEEFMQEMRCRYPNLTAVVTLGSQGCVWFDAERAVFQPAFRVNAVDTTGAGDTFTGYFLSSLSKGECVERALQLASCASALAVSVEGAASSIPTIDAVLCALDEFKKIEKYSK